MRFVAKKEGVEKYIFFFFTQETKFGTEAG